MSAAKPDDEGESDAPKLAAVVALFLGLPLLCGACLGTTGLFALIGGGFLAGAGAWAWGGAGLAALVLMAGGTVLFLRRRRVRPAHNPCARKIEVRLP